MSYPNRIVGNGEKPASEFNPNPLNWRIHSQAQRSALNSILEQVGWVTGVIVNRTTGNLIDGHARVEEALEKDPAELVPFIEVELSEEEEKKILLLFDPIGSMAVSDGERLKTLSELLQIEDHALLEVMAGLAGAASLHTVELAKETHEMGEKIDYFSFGDVKIMLSKEELAGLLQRYQAHVSEHGTHFGFVAALLDL